jgi:hypothetical protein
MWGVSKAHTPHLPFYLLAGAFFNSSPTYIK